MPQASENQLIAQADSLLKAHQWAKAERMLRKLTKHRPKDTTVLARLSTAQQKLGYLTKALDTLKKASQISPADSGLLMQLAETYYDNGQLNESLAHANRSIALSPTDGKLRRTRATLLMRTGDPHAACEDLQAAHDAAPDDLLALSALVDGIIAGANVPMDTAPASLLLKRQPFEAKNHARLGTIHRLNGDHDQAMSCYDKALSIDRFSSDARTGKAEILVSRKEPQEAAELLRPLINAPTCSILPMKAWMRVCKNLDRHQDAIVAAERWLNSERRSPAHTSALCHGIAQSYDLLDQRAEAFEAWSRANAIDASRWDAAEHTRTTDSIIDTFDLDSCSTFPTSTCESTMPTFIVGMFRSGTSLTEQILDTHHDITGAGELPDMFELLNSLHEEIGEQKHYPECMTSITSAQLDSMATRYLDTLAQHAGSSRRVTDKMPLNYLNIGLISLMFPKAKIIHCTRDALDTCFSCWGNPFSARAAFTANLESLGNAYVDYARIMDHWMSATPQLVHTIVYEELVQDPEPVVRGMLDFLELEWDQNCLAFH
ncbi:MAG: sulfotransferase, partial [Phycisphaerales bacterium]|nr:sulfotransferase [Phycisphaerales bacterium]